MTKDVSRDELVGGLKLRIGRLLDHSLHPVLQFLGMGDQDMRFVSESMKLLPLLVLCFDNRETTRLVTSLFDRTEMTTSARVSSSRSRPLEAEIWVTGSSFD